MALKNAPLCTKCKAHRTLDPSGMCIHCRRRVSNVCKICGSISTTHASGLCYRCRRRCPSGSSILDKAIASHEKTLEVLKMRKENLSFSDIANVTGMSKTSVYTIYHSALHLPDWANSTMD